MQSSHKLPFNIFAIFCLLFFSISTCIAATPVTSGFIPVEQGKIYYEKYGKGDPILVIHGGPGLDQGYLKPQLLELAKGHEVIFYDQRGSGKSLDTVMDRSVVNLAQFTDDIEVVRKALHLDHVVVLGHSWGGLLAMSYAIKYPEHISKLVLVDSMPADVAGIFAAASELDKRLEPIRDQVDALNYYDEIEKLTSQQLSEMYRKVFAVYFHNPNLASKLSLDISVDAALSGFNVQQLLKQDLFINLIPQLQKLAVPTTVIIGESDVVPMWTAEAIAKAIPNAKLVKLAECGHFPYIEQPEQFYAAINF